MDKNASMAQLSAWTEAMNNKKMDKNSSMAQLSSWTDVMRKNEGAKQQIKSIPIAADPDDDYEDEFEDYEEEFEPQIAPSKDVKTPQIIIDDSKKETKSSAVKAPEVKYDSMSQSLARSIADPRSIRIQRILKSGVVNLQLERFTVLNLVPTSKYDFYLGELMKQNSFLQIGVPADAEIRDVEVFTEEIKSKNQEVQFCLDDDTKFYQLLERVRNRNSQPFDSRVTAEVEENLSSVGNLSSFLSKSMQTFDLLLSDTSTYNEQKNLDKYSHENLFSSNNKISYGTDNTVGANELIRFRDRNEIRFSPVDPSVLLVIHPYPEDDKQEADLRPLKGLLTLWNLSSMAGPTYVLESSGQPTTGCFSRLQSYFVLAGTNDGTLNLWDLRESNSLHKDRDSEDLKILKGIRKPAFKTSFTLENYQENLGHSSAIVQIECLDVSEDSHVFSPVAQFVSLDEFGILVFWVTSESASSFQPNVHLRNGSSVSLLQTRKLTSSGLHDLSLGWSKYSNSLFSLLPFDLSSLLVSACDDVLRISRHNQIFRPQKFVVNSDANHQNPSAHRISSILPVSVESLNDQLLFFVGRIDGSLSLYRIDQSLPLYTWDLNGVPPADSRKPSAIITLKWISHVTTLLVVLQCGVVYEFDFSAQFDKPLRFGSIDNGGLHGQLLSISENKLSNEIKIGVLLQGSKAVFDIYPINYDRRSPKRKPTKLLEWLISRM